MGIGSGGTVLLQQWTSTSRPIPTARAEREPPPPAALITELLLTGEPFMGSGNAPLTIVEFSDFECPYCRRFHEQVLPSLKREYIDTGLVRFIHKDLPLPFHDQAGLLQLQPVAPANKTATGISTAPSSISKPAWNARASSRSPKELNLDTSALQACMQREATDTLITTPIFLKPNCTTSAPRQPSSSGPAAMTGNTSATSLKGRCPGLNSKP